jgi:hypothetical protein
MIKIEGHASEHVSFREGLRELWEGGRLCDCTLRSRDRMSFEVHKVVIAAASESLATLLSNDQYREAGQRTVTLDVSGGALAAILSYIYRGVAQLDKQFAPEMVGFAHMHGLKELQGHATKSILASLDMHLAMRMLVDCDVLCLDDVGEECERHVAENFEQSVSDDCFVHLPAACLGRILQRDDLRVPHEAFALGAVMTWRALNKDRDALVGLLLQHVRFSMMDLRTLLMLQRWSQSAGSVGIEMLRGVKMALHVHHANAAFDGPPLKKRRCTMHWWPVIGASSGGSKILDFTDQPVTDITCQDGAVIACHDKCVKRWIPGAQTGQVIAGEGAPINGVNVRAPAKATFGPDGGELFIAETGSLFGPDGGRIIRIRDSIGEVVGGGNIPLRFPVHVSVAGRQIYAADDTMKSIVKLVGGEKQLVVRSNGERNCLNQFHTAYFVVTEEEEIFICDHSNHRVLKWSAGSTSGTVVAGGNGPGDRADQLDKPSGIFLAADRSLYVADTNNHRVMRWCSGASAGVVVAGGHGQGDAPHQLSKPLVIHIDSTGALYVLDNTSTENRCNRVTRWEPTAISVPWMANYPNAKSLLSAT